MSIQANAPKFEYEYVLTTVYEYEKISNLMSMSTSNLPVWISIYTYYKYDCKYKPILISTTLVNVLKCEYTWVHAYAVQVCDKVQVQNQL